MMRRNVWGLGLIVAMCAPGAALAEDWTASKLRGTVFVAEGQQWVPLVRGQAVTDGQAVRTMASGYVEFSRGGETIDLAANTQVQVSELQNGAYTKVNQYFGAVTIADQHTAKPHFEVDTPFIAAVVKGTVFTVTSDRKLSSVVVKEGAVQVNDNATHGHVLITAGQHASAGPNQPLISGGAGIATTTTVTKNGKVITTVTGSAGSTVAGVVQTVGNVAGGTVSTVTGTATGVVSTTTNTVTTVVNTASSTVTSLTNSLKLK